MGPCEPLWATWAHLREVVDAVGRRHLVGVGEDREERRSLQDDVDAQKQTLVVLPPENVSKYIYIKSANATEPLVTKTTDNTALRNEQ